ncbi:unnamed protein product, partial [Linum tenue]
FHLPPRPDLHLRPPLPPQVSPALPPAAERGAAAAGLRRPLLHQPPRRAADVRRLLRRQIDPPRVPRPDRRARLVDGREVPRRGAGDPRNLREGDAPGGPRRREAHRRAGRDQRAPRERGVEEDLLRVVGCGDCAVQRVRSVRRSEIRSLRAVQRQPQDLLGEARVPKLRCVQRQRFGSLPGLLPACPPPHVHRVAPRLLLHRLLTN